MPGTKLLGLFTGLASRLKRQRSPQTQKSRVPLLLADLPFVILLDVFLHLDFEDVLSLSQASRWFYDVSQSFVIWKNLAFKLMCRGRRISLHDHLSTSALTAAQLKQSVLLTTAAEASWLKPMPVHVARPHPIRLADVDLDHASYIMKFTSKRHLVLPTKGGELVGWDTRTSSCAGKYNMSSDSVLINVQGVYATRSLYWITGKISSDPEHEQNLHIKILRIQFPEPSSSDPVSFDVLGDLVTPWSLAAELHFLDASQRMICAVFLNEETCTAGLHVVLDWSTGLSYMFDTGIIYEYGRAVIGLHLSLDKQWIILRSEECGREIRRAYSLEEMRSRAFIWNAARRPTYSLPLVHSAASALSRWEHEHPMFDFSMAPHTVWVLPQWWPTYPGVPSRSSTIILYLSFAEGPMGETRRVWRAAQHYSDAVETATADREDVDEKYGATSVWGCDGEMVGGAPCSAARSVVDIGANAVTISLGNHGLPILAQSFNHLGWIEESVEGEEIDEDVDGRRRRRFSKLRPRNLITGVRRRVSTRSRASSSRSPSPPRRTRVLKLVTFPDPGISPISPICSLNRKRKRFRVPGRRRRQNDLCGCTTLEPVTLDVPASVLDRVYHMFLDPAAGTITLATEDNELHVYQYGLPFVSPYETESAPSETDPCMSPPSSGPAALMPVVYG